MKPIATLTVACAASLALVSFHGGRIAIDEAVRASGADSIKTLQFTASGATFSVRTSRRAIPATLIRI